MAQTDPDYQIKCQIIQEVQLCPLLYNKGIQNIRSIHATVRNSLTLGFQWEKQVSKHRSSQEHVDLFMYFGWNNRHKASSDIYFCNVAKEVATIWKNLLNSYRKKVKSGSSGKPIDECASQWRYFEHMNFLKSLIGSKKYVNLIYIYTS